MEHPKLKLTIPWTDIDENAQLQINNVLKLPELERLVIMPDAHSGYDLCIGAVALMRGVISPSFVGYDIGCGMCHINTGLSARELGLHTLKRKQQLFEKLYTVIPAGVGKTHQIESDIVFESALGDEEFSAHIQSFVNTQLATLGSGNHFLEIGENKAGNIGITLHSGSRRAGYDIAALYMKKGRLLPLESELAQAYMADMQWALSFALENRRLMLLATLRAMGFAEEDCASLLAPDVLINENHNHAVPYGDNLILHRKGATPAELEQLGVIPANQRDGVWITRGLGNKEFLASASHGAGRKMSRRAALRNRSVADLEKVMQGIVCRTDKAMRDEAPWGYKNIDAVLAAQDGLLVDVIDHFKPLIVVKG